MHAHAGAAALPLASHSRLMRPAASLPRRALLHSRAAACSSSAAAAAATSGTPATAAAKPSSGQGLKLYVWGGGQASISGRTQSTVTSFLRRLVGKAPAPGRAPSSSQSPLHKLTLAPTEVPSPDGSGFRDVSFGHQHGAFVTGSGELYTWGVGSRCQLGHGKPEDFVEQPKRVLGLPGPVAQVVCGKAHTLVLTEAGELLSFGVGGTFTNPSVLGTEDTSDAPSPRAVRIKGDPRVVQISAGSVHNLVRTQEGRVYAFGQGGYGRLGTGSSGNAQLPVMLQALQAHRIVHITSGSSFNGALDDEGNVYTWGRGDKGQLGLGNGISPDQSAMESVPSRVEFPSEEEEVPRRTKVTSLTAGYKHMLALAPGPNAVERAELYQWGLGSYKPVRQIHFRIAHTFQQLGAGDSFSLASDNEGALASWGRGSSGCLGHGNKNNVNEPAFITGFGASPERSGCKSKPEKYMGSVKHIKAAFNHCAVLVHKP